MQISAAPFSPISLLSHRRMTRHVPPLGLTPSDSDVTVNTPCSTYKKRAERPLKHFRFSVMLHERDR